MSAVLMKSDSGLPDLDDIRAAATLIAPDFPPTPAIVWPLLEQAVGTRVVTKHENHTRVGAFKGRGGLVYMHKLVTENPSMPGIITATRGNHGQSLALAATRYQRRAVVLVPKGNSEEKNTAMRALGAELIEFGDDYQAAREEADRRSEAEGLQFVPPFQTDLMAGVATYWLEFFTAHADLDVVVVPVGMGSGVCSAIRVRDLLGLPTRIHAVVSSHAPAYQLSFAARAVRPHPATTFLADGLACSTPDEQALGMILNGVETVHAVSDEQVAEAMRVYFRTTHNVVEGAAAAPLAAVLAQPDRYRDMKVGLPITGGNVDAAVFSRVLAGETPTG